ncbi:Fcf1-domain-containing protein [Meredithblackwellia eburnea MCA 4105]
MFQITVGKARQGKTRKFAAVKRMIAPTDMRLAPLATSLFLSHNEALVPPYRVLVDTNFINLSLENRVDIIKGMMDTLYAKCIPCISDCVIAELEKLGHQYRLALRVARDPRFERLPCSHKGTYADDCIVNRVSQHRCYIVATCDRDLRRRLRKVPGVPLMYISKKRYAIERLPDQALG